MAACDICLEPFDSQEHTPRILPCGHSICESCLVFLHIYSADGNLSSASPLCPKCRQTITVPTLKQLPKNFSLIDSQVQSKSLLCPLHGDLGLPALLFCVRCGVYVCHKCIATTHNRHQFEDLEKRAHAMKKSIVALKENAAAQKRRQEKELSLYENKKVMLQSLQDVANKSVQSYFAELRVHLETEEAAYLDEIRILYQKDHDEIDSLIELVQKRLATVEKVLRQWEGLETRLEKMSEKEVLGLQEGSQELLSLKIATGSIEFQPTSEYHVHQYVFKARKDVRSFSDFGVIHQEGVSEYLLMLGPDRSEANHCWVLSIASREWEAVDIEVDLRAYAAACFLDDYQAVVLTGGKDEAASRSTQILYPAMRRSDNRSPMLSPRAGHSCAYLQNHVYVFGGFNEELGTLDSCEDFDFLADRWEERKPMHEKRSLFGMCLYNRDVYVFGGFAKRYLNSIERYIVRSDRWLLMNVSLPYSAAGLAACVAQGSIFLLGGMQGQSCFSNAHRFVPENGEIQPVRSMREDRAFAKAFGLGEKIIVLGGRRSFSAEELREGDWVEIKTNGGVKDSIEKFTCVALV